jgi:hypothetical protein
MDFAKSPANLSKVDLLQNPFLFGACLETPEVSNMPVLGNVSVFQTLLPENATLWLSRAEKTLGRQRRAVRR